MRRVKIYGAGSIGNHLAHAARQLGWQVVVCDVADAALRRMKEEIYPSRYGSWDESIQLYQNAAGPRGGFEVICIGTPPESHLPLALEALRERPKAILVEKPLCTPSMERTEELSRLVTASGTKVFVGYNHVVSKATRKMEEVLRSGAIGEVQTIEVEFREHWDAIFKAHPWLDGPEDSYLGFWQRGGGASGEQSHAVNLWQHFAHVAGAGRVVEVDAMLTYVTQGTAVYDSLCLLSLRTESGLVGHVAQDVITSPPRIRARIQGVKGALEWVSGDYSTGDTVVCLRPGMPAQVSTIEKRRPDDFIEELKHLQAQWEGEGDSSPIRLERGLATMLVLGAAHRSEREGSRVRIDYRKGYARDALRPWSFQKRRFRVSHGSRTRVSIRGRLGTAEQSLMTVLP